MHPRQHLPSPSLRRAALLALCLCTGAASAQDDPLIVPQRAFIDQAANQLVFRGDSSAWEGYHNKVDKLMFEGRGQVNIVHIGGSHIQADMWSQELRYRMQSVVPGVRAARGFIFPYNMAKSNNPYWYFPEFSGAWTWVKNTQRADSTQLGLAGYSATTRDTLTNLKVSFRGEAYPGYTFDRVKVLHAMDSSFAIEAWTKDSTITITQHTDAAAGFTELTYSAQTDTLFLRFVKRDPAQKRFTLYGITLETDDPGFVYHAIGVNGASTPSYLRCQRFSDDLALLKPDLVVFSIGINDAHDPDFSAERYERNYDELISRVKRVAPDAAILLTTNTDSYINKRTVNPNGHAVRDVMLRLSAKHGCAVWDTYGVMGGPGSIARWEDAGMAKKDRVHLTRPGYVLLGDLLFSAMMEKYGEHVKRSAKP